MGVFKGIFSSNSASSCGFDVNPANGLPMADCFIDVMGNPYGTDLGNLGGTDSISFGIDSIGMDTDIHDRDPFSW